MNNFLNVTCSFQGFHPSATDKQKKTGIAAACHTLPGVVVRAITFLDISFVFVCVYVCMHMDVLYVCVASSRLLGVH